MSSTTALLMPPAPAARTKTARESSRHPSSFASTPLVPASPNVWRHELKYVVSPYARAALTQDLRALADPDPHGDPQGFYLVRSLYLDSADWRLFFEKRAGLSSRHKLRVRGYVDGDGEVSGIKFEIKHRQGQRIAKVVAGVRGGDDPWGDYRRLLPYLQEQRFPDFQELADSPELCRFFSLKAIGGLRPVLNVQFRRQAFIARADASVRITLDDRLAARRALDLLDPWPANSGNLSGRDTILEIKVRRSVPFWLSRLIQKYRLRTESISKYCQAVCNGPFGLDANS